MELIGNGKIKMEETGDEEKLQKYKIGMNAKLIKHKISLKIKNLIQSLCCKLMYLDKLEFSGQQRHLDPQRMSFGILVQKIFIE